MGATVTETAEGHHTYTFNRTLMDENAHLLVAELFADLNLLPQPAPAKVEEEGPVGTPRVPELTVNFTKQLSYFGKSIAVGDFNGDGVKEAFIGAPGYSLKAYGQLGAVYYSSLNPITPEIDPSQPHLTANTAYSRFGFSLAAMDVNRDGVDDLVVSAPAYGLGGPSDISDYYAKAYAGRVYVYLAIPGLGIKKGSQPSFSFAQSRNGDTDVFFNLGQNLKVSDCNGDGKDDLLILSPMSQQGGDKRGHVAVFYDFMSKLNGTNDVLFMEDADFTAHGYIDFQWFGFDAVCVGSNTIVIGSPGSRTRSPEQAHGAVFAYDLTTGKQLYSLISPDDQAKFGSSLSFNPVKNLLAVGAPSRSNGEYYHAGAAFVYDLSDDNKTFENYKTMYHSYERGARFGKQVLWAGDEDLVVSAPSLTSYNTLAVPNEQGKVFWFEGADGLNGDYSTFWAKKTFETVEAGCRHGDFLKWVDATGQLLVGSPMCHNFDSYGTQQRMAGRVHLFEEAKNNQTVVEVVPSLFLA